MLICLLDCDYLAPLPLPSNVNKADIYVFVLANTTFQMEWA